MRRWLCMLTIAAMTSGASVLAQPPEGDRPRADRPPGDRGPGDRGPEGFRPPPSPLIAVLDVDGNREISADELKNASAALAKLDKDNNGKLTAEEIRPPGPDRRPDAPRPAEGLRDEPRRPDRPDDGGRAPGRPDDGARDRRPEGDDGARRPQDRGGPSPEMRAERMLAHAIEFDDDADGKLSKEELRKFIGELMKQRPGPFPGPGSGPGRGPGAPDRGPDRDRGRGSDAPGDRPADGESPQRPDRPRRPD